MARKSVTTESLVKRVEVLSTLTKTPLSVLMGAGGLQLQRDDTRELLGPRGTKTVVIEYVQAMIDGIALFEPAVMVSDVLTEEDLEAALQAVLADAAAEATPAPDAFGHRPPAPLKPYTETPEPAPFVPDQSAIDELDALLDGIDGLDLERGISD
jgi:hypothetical protein